MRRRKHRSRLTKKVNRWVVCGYAKQGIGKQKMSREWQERELEDYLWMNPGALGKVTHYGGICKKEFVPLGRQIRCNTGIIDMLFYSFTALYVVELKATMADMAAFGQLSRYATEVTSIVEFPFMVQLKCNPAEYTEFANKFIEIHRVIVAPRFHRDLACMLDENVSMIVAEKTDNGFVLSRNNEYARKYSDDHLLGTLMPFFDHMAELNAEYMEFERRKSLPA